MEHISKGRISRYASLSRKKSREETGLFLAEGEKCVGDSIDSFEVECVVATPEWWGAHPQFLRYPALEATEAEMRKISSLATAPQVVAVLRIPSEADNVQVSGLIPVLDGIQDPGNFGTILRIADWFGMPLVIASKDTVDLYNPKTVQATMGALGKVRVVYADLPQFFGAHPEMPVFGTLLEGRDIYAAKLEPQGFIVFGNEGKGISPKVRELVTEPLLIPCYAQSENHSESLNVAVAAAVTIAEFRRRFP